MSRLLLEVEKDSGMLAQHKDTPFLLSLRDPQEFSALHSFGLYKVPHIGVYGSDYSVCSPVALISLPAVPRVLKQFPHDLLSALDLESSLTLNERREKQPLCPNPPSLFQPPRIYFQPPGLHFQPPRIHFQPPGLHSPFAPPKPSEAELLLVARDLVRKALESARKKVKAEIRMCTANRRHQFLSTGVGRYRSPKTHSDTAPTNMEISIQVPTIRLNHMDTSSETSAPPRALGGTNRPIPIPTVVVQDVTMREDTEAEARIQDVAKRLVLKCIRSACCALEAERGYVDPIEDLISSAKRMRISDPPPSEHAAAPPLPRTTPPVNEEQDLPLPLATPPAKSVTTKQEDSEPETAERAVTPESMKRQNVRKKRGRSDSHEVNSLVDYEKIRRHLHNKPLGGLGDSITEEAEEGSEEEEDEEVADKLTSLVKMMTIDDDCSLPRIQHDAEATNFRAPSNFGRTDPAFLKSNFATIHEVTSNKIHSPLVNATNFFSEHVTTPTTVDPGTPKVGTLPHTSPHAPSNVGALSCTNPPTNTSMFPHMGPTTNMGTFPHMGPSIDIGTFPHMGPPPPHADPREAANMGAVPHMGPPTDPREGANVGAVPHMDLFVTIHTSPPSGLCQKFLCDNTDEINLLYHCWLFPEASCDPHVTLTEQLEMGVFEPHGVRPVHMDLQDAGAPFHVLDKRTVCIHSYCFSPNNAHLQLTHLDTFHTFFSAARHNERRAVVLHILPATTLVESQVRQVLGECSTLTQLLQRLSVSFPEITHKISQLVSAL